MLSEIESQMFHLENSIRNLKKRLKVLHPIKDEFEMDLAKKYIKGYQDNLDLLILKQK